MRLKRGEGDSCDAMVPYVAEKSLMQDRMQQVLRLARRHTQLQARHLAQDLEVQLRCRAKAAATDLQECEKQQRLDYREALQNEERERRIQERHDHEARTMEKAHHLEWATIAAHMNQQDFRAQRQYEAGLIRAAEEDRLMAARKVREADIEARLREHEASLQRAREQKAAEWEAKIARITAMEARRDEILDELARIRQDAYAKYDALKELAYESHVQNDDDVLRRILEKLVPRLATIPHTLPGASPRRYRALSTGPATCPTLTPRQRNTNDRRAQSLDCPGRLVGIGGARRLLPATQLPSRDEAEKLIHESRSTSRTSLANSGILTSSHGSLHQSWESLSNPSPIGYLVASRKLPGGDAEASLGISSISTAAVDSPVSHNDSLHRPMRGIGIDIGTYANTARATPEASSRSVHSPARGN